MYMVMNGQVRVIHFFSQFLIGSQLIWSAREKECCGIYYGVKLFEDLLDNRYKLTIRSLAKRNINSYLMPCHDCVRTMYLHHLLWLTDA